MSGEDLISKHVLSDHMIFKKFWTSVEKSGKIVHKNQLPDSLEVRRSGDMEFPFVLSPGLPGGEGQLNGPGCL